MGWPYRIQEGIWRTGCRICRCLRLSTHLHVLVYLDDGENKKTLGISLLPCQKIAKELKTPSTWQPIFILWYRLPTTYKLLRLQDKRQD